jgi:eukaryotic-like serine/threonine-protein kinase
VSASTTADLAATEQGRAMFQQRVASFGLSTGSAFLIFLAYRAISVVASGEPEELLDPDMLMHLVAVVVMLGMWLSCRTGIRSPAFVRTVETVGLIGGSLALELMGASISPYRAPELILLMALTFLLVARAVLVPSTPRRTTWLGVVIGLPLLVITYQIYTHVDPVRLLAIDPSAVGMTPHRLGLQMVLWTAMWWAMSVFICRLAAKVIFGLRTEVHDIRRLGQYTLEHKIGEGGMGAVYRASHAMLKRPTAIKLLPPDKAGESTLQRFEREVQLTAALTHPNTIRVFDYGRTPDGVFYYVMELLEGANLDDLVELDGPQPPGRIVHILAAAAGALAEAHGMGLIHRDIKPANIMLVDRGGVPDVAKVLDFGLVKDMRPDAEDGTKTGMHVVMGTPLFLSPEAIKAPDSVDGRSDIYALGAVAYFLLTGHYVFDGGTVVEICSDHLHKAPAPPSQRIDEPIPADLESLILDCLAKDPDHRPASAEAFRERLLGCDVPRWQRADARRWWDRIGGTLAERRRKRVTSATGRTIEIDAGFAQPG